MRDLSIIIVTYNNEEILNKCLNSIIQSSIRLEQIEIILIDNNSVDATVSIFLEFKKSNKLIHCQLIQNNNNIGFGAANNKGIRIARGRFLLLLNSDVILEKNTLEKQLQFMKEHDEYAVSTCKLKLADGSMDPACHRGFPTIWASISYFSKLEKLFPNSKIFARYHQGWHNLQKVHDIDAISGGFFMVKKETLDKVGLFDEGFFMYGEDLDLCLRIRQAQMRIGFNPNTQALHLKGQSGRKKKNDHRNTSKTTSYHFWNAMKLFYLKHYKNKYSKLVSFLVLKTLGYKIKQYAK